MLLFFIVVDGVVQPDITQTVVAIHNHNILDTPNNNHIGSSTSEKEAIFADNAINTNKSLLLDHSPAQRSDSKVSLKSAGGGDVNDARPASVYSDTANNRHSTLSCQLPSNIDAESLVWTKVTHAGGRITLPDSGVYTHAGITSYASSEWIIITDIYNDPQKTGLIYILC